MNGFNCYHPTEIRFGSGRINEIGKVIAGLGSRCLIVSTCKSGSLEDVYRKITELLEGEGVAVYHFDRVVNNPTTDSVNKGVEVAEKNRVDVVLGIGGGSSMDTAKAVAVGATHPGEAWDYRLFTDNKITDKTLPIVVITTTSGTGSQVTPVSVVTNPAEKCKFALVDKLLVPKVGIIDPEIMLSLPEDLTAATGFDVFAHAFESYIHKNASPYTDLLAGEAIRLVVNYLPVVITDGQNLVGREKMAWADILAGLCIANAGTTLPHGIGMAVGGHAPHVRHGEALAAVYPEFMRFTYGNAVNKFASLARMFNPGLVDISPEKAAEESCVEMESFLARIGLDLSLGQLKVSRDELPEIIADSLKLPDYRVNPRIADRNQIANIINQSY